MATPNPNDTTYQSYLAQEFGSGVGANLTEQGTHKVADGVIAAYGANGQAVPATLTAPLQELRDIAQSEYSLRNSSPEARRALAFGGAYDPLAVGNRERALVAQITQATQGVYLQQADLSAASNRQAYAEAQAGTAIAGQKVRMNEQKLAEGEITLNAARMQAEIDQATARGQAASIGRAAAAQTMLDTLGDVSTFDMLDALNADNPQIAQGVFGKDTTRDVQLQAMQLRLAQENAMLQASGQGSGRGTAVNGQAASAVAAVTQMGALQMRQTENVIATLGPNVTAVANGAMPLPEGITLQEAQRASQLQQARQQDSNQLSVDLANNALDLQNNATETGFRIMSTMPTGDLGALAEAAAAGQPITLAIPNSDATITLDPQQATQALQKLEAGLTAKAQADAVRSLGQETARSFGLELGKMQQTLQSVTNGNIPARVQQALAQEKLTIANAVTSGDPAGLVSSVSRIEQAMLDAGMTEAQVSMVIFDRFPDEATIGAGASNILGQSPDSQRFTPVTNAFLAQLENRASNSDYPLDPSRMAKIRQLLTGDASGADTAAELESILGYPPQELRGMMQSALIGSVFSNGFSDFINKLTASPDQGGLGLLSTGDAQQLRTDVQAATRERVLKGEPLTAESYIQTVKAFASAYTLNDADQRSAMNAFYSALQDNSGGDLFRRVDGSVGNDELALFALINNMTDSGPAFGQGSTPLSDLPEVLGAQLSDQIAQSVLGQQRVTDASPQQQALSYTVGQLLGIDTQSAITGATLIPSSDLNNPASLMEGQTAPDGKSFIFRGNQPGSLADTQQILQINPRLTQFVAGIVLPQIIGASARPTHWYDLFVLGTTVSIEESAAMLSGVDFNDLQRQAAEAGLLGGQ